MLSRSRQGSALAEGEKELTEEELIEQIREVKLGHFLLASATTLASLSYAKLEAGELAETRLGIDALRALAPLLQGQVEDEERRGVEQVLANLQIAYADAVATAPSAASD
jgi:hypothetical protein